MLKIHFIYIEKTLNINKVILFKDIDECVQKPCDINELCENTFGSFKCHCKSGFQLDEVTNACTGSNAILCIVLTIKIILLLGSVSIYNLKIKCFILLIK